MPPAIDGLLWSLGSCTWSAFVSCFLVMCITFAGSCVHQKSDQVKLLTISDPSGISALAGAWFDSRCETGSRHPSGDSSATFSWPSRDEIEGLLVETQ